PQILQVHQDLLARSTQHILQGTHDIENNDFLAGKVSLIGLYFGRRGLKAEAAAMYQAGLNIQPNSFDLHNNYGGVLLVEGQFPASLEQFNAAYNEQPNNPVVNKNLGLLLLKWGDIAQAAHFFERTLFFKPAQWDAASLLGETYLKLGRVQDAVHALQSALTLYKQSTAQNRLAQGDIDAQLGEAYIRLGRFPDATRVLQSALTLYEESTAQPDTDAYRQTMITWMRENLHYLEQGLTKSLLP